MDEEIKDPSEVEEVLPAETEGESEAEPETETTGEPA